MITFFALILAIVLQFAGAIVAISNIRRTKYSISWILISLGFLVMAIQRFIEFIPYVWRGWEKDVATINTWLGIITSILIAVGVIYIRKILDFLRKVEREKQESQKKILNAVIQTEEKERRRLAKELHDGMGPLLSAVKMAVSSLVKTETNANNKLIIDNTDQMITEAIRSLKEISNNLSPHVLENFGLASAIKSFSSKISATRTIQIMFFSNMFDVRLNNNTEIIIYRVACELINNTIKHANAQNIEIELKQHGKIITLLYTDDGCGFDTSLTMRNENKGMGLSNIITRIKSIKGAVNIESSPGKGLKVIIIVNT
jgi:signal transduction histidine kinase